MVRNLEVGSWQLEVDDVHVRMYLFWRAEGQQTIATYPAKEGHDSSA
jgi:hypothetical protein